MFPKKNRVNKKLIEKIFKKGVFVNSENLNLKYYIEDRKISPKISFFVPKAIEKSAVRRNYLKRQGYLMLKNFFNKIPEGFLGVFIFKKIKNKENLPGNIKKEIEKILKTIIKK
jgi:ribonuclease P protein component